MGSPKFMRPKPGGHGGGGGEISPNLYVANCGPAVGLSFDAIARAFGEFGPVTGVYDADGSGTRVIVSFSDEGAAEAAFTAFNCRPCSQLAGRFLHIRYSVPRPSTPVRGNDSVEVCLTAKELNIAGLYLFHDFISPKDEEELLAAVDSRPWISLAKRRVQHYGYEFCYQLPVLPFPFWGERLGEKNMGGKGYKGVLPCLLPNIASMGPTQVSSEFMDGFLEGCPLTNGRGMLIQQSVWVDFHLLFLLCWKEFQHAPTSIVLLL